MDLNQVTIPSIDVNESVIFYKKLGLLLIVDASPRYVRFEVPDGNTTFSIHQVERLPKGEGVTLYFEDDNLDELVEELQQKGIQFTQLPIDQRWLWREAHLLDPDGNKLILFKAGEHRKNLPWRIN
ncbi:glyoxalase/bleomycin resistance/extradiol dioxygenase family protein [Tenacibaculum discolor]|uniref:Glyoxalase/bleomycin resistance/extradiol dioxygenase family protein n=1 Tax=Tenacibaculum discolor TaxID=361581 RepID=A0A2G1BSW9_9FLAO|nr:VOC family protein [Tenacibaculum discolor]MDP2542811.1 VOC family protein [Tenacibaculum discolor]PHN97024.1 glyoxalase/bleomycin resistance/extradiol dioxygenase family protein [Tenacibaculum discolor]PHO01656.1 glyoxalase/bleomycin resistance/extradiol dioxygenase family protein [Rhodobacteraceae bacterium 4F10]